MISVKNVTKTFDGFKALVPEDWEVAYSRGANIVDLIPDPEGETFPDGCGHTGFTGTSLWVSRKHGLGAVILTNKFYRPEGEPPGNSNEFRRAVHYALLGRTPPPVV